MQDKYCAIQAEGCQIKKKKICSEESRATKSAALWSRQLEQHAPLVTLRVSFQFSQVVYLQGSGKEDHIVYYRE